MKSWQLECFFSPDPTDCCININTIKHFGDVIRPHSSEPRWVPHFLPPLLKPDTQQRKRSDIIAAPHKPAIIWSSLDLLHFIVVDLTKKKKKAIYSDDGGRKTKTIWWTRPSDQLERRRTSVSAVTLFADWRAVFSWSLTYFHIGFILRRLFTFSKDA